jgi:GAF domain-containing protein
MMRGDEAIGLLSVVRLVAGPLSDKQLAVLRTFANQAVIAIENTRLLNETKEALEQQTATSQILGVISSSPTDLAPVFDAILASAMQLCEAHLGICNLYDGEWLRTVAQRGGNPQLAKWLLERGSIKPDGGMTHQAISERRAVQIADVREAPGYREGKPNISKFVDLGGVRTFLAVPLLKEGAVIGTIGIYRPEVRPFTDKQIGLLKTFADQAVIAIENARLFNELQDKNRALTEAHARMSESLEEQTATADILRVIASSPTDLQPVMQTVARNAARLCEAVDAQIFRVEEGGLRLVAVTGAIPQWPVGTCAPISRGWVTGRAVVDCQPVHVHDLPTASEVEFPQGKLFARELGHRTTLAVPLVR